MHTFFKTVAVTFSLFATAGVAHADEQQTSSVEGPLGMVIAVQGDQALVDIQQALTHTIASSVTQLMETSLTEIHGANDVATTTAEPAGAYVLALKAAR